MSDKEILIQSVDSYVKGLASNLFHLNGIATGAVINYVLKNIEDKYGYLIDFFVDKQGNINVELLGNSIKEELKNQTKNGLVVNILGKPVKFDSSDVDEILNKFKELKKNK